MLAVPPQLTEIDGRDRALNPIFDSKDRFSYILHLPHTPLVEKEEGTSNAPYGGSLAGANTTAYGVSIGFPHGASDSSHGERPVQREVAGGDPSDGSIRN